MTGSRKLGILALAALIPAGMAIGKGGRPGGGGGFGQNGMGWNRNAQTKPPVDPVVEAQKKREKIEKLLGDGFADLRAHDSLAALDAFSDVIQLDAENPRGHLGMGLARAQKRQYEAGETEFTSAGNFAKRAKANPKPDPNANPDTESPTAFQSYVRLANYDLAVTFTRLESRPRALVLFDKAVAESKPVDEILVNAQRSVMAMMDSKARAAIAAMPVMLKTLHTADASLLAAHAPLRRWGVTWMAGTDAEKHYALGEAEPLPKELPYLMPGDEVMPETVAKKTQVADAAQPPAAAAELVNPLAPIVVGDVQVAAGPAVPPDPTAAPGPVPPPIAKPDAPAQPEVPPAVGNDPTPPAVNSVKPPPVISHSRTLTGAAFAVAPDLLLTCSRLTTGASTISVQATDGENYQATLVASDETLGVALIKVEGGKFSPMAIAENATSGAVHIPAFIRPGVFGPELDMLSGTLSASPTAAFLRTASHPRSAGSPLMDSKGQVVGLLVATRDDPLAHLPVVTASDLRKFASGKFTSVTETAASGPEDCVLELSATREE